MIVSFILFLIYIFFLPTIVKQYVQKEKEKERTKAIIRSIENDQRSDNSMATIRSNQHN